MAFQRRRKAMILSTVKVEDFDRFWNTFRPEKAELVREHDA